MKTIETTVNVSGDHRISLQLPAEIASGEHRIVLVFDEKPAPGGKRPPLNMPIDSYGSWPADLSLRREDMYEDFCI